MNQTGRTLTYVVVAGGLLAWALAAGPEAVDPLAVDETGAFFPSWKDPLAPTSLEVVEFDEDTGTVHPFKVMQVDGKWSIPSHSNYPTDAERQLAEAAATVFELQKLSMVSTQKSDHSLYGVVDPDPSTLKGGEEGVGKRVVLKDKQDKTLAQLIIGKEDKGQAGIRFVRVPGQDAVYRAEIRPDKLTTKFENWIEKDLLKMNTWDIKDIVLNNYSLDEVNGRIVPGDVLELSYDGDKSKWDLKDLKEGEELATDKLNGLRDALDNLKIVDVRRKPDGLSRELRAAEGIQLDREAIQNLAARGFFVFQGNLISNEGEAITKMKDGVVYVLRFGEIALNTGGPADKKEEAAEGEEQKDKTEAASTGANRYIFVMAQFDESQIPKPELKPLPGETQPSPPENKTSQTGSSGGDETLLAQAQDAKPEKKADDKKSEDSEKAPADEKKEEPKDGAKEEPKSKADQDRERKEIEKENKRKQDEYNDKVKKAQDRVKELNDRFADWYYVISDSEYKKIHLSRADVIKAKEGADKSEDKTGVETFNKLKQEGLKE
jgi:hypothetical protein